MQGGVYLDLRTSCAESVVAFDLPGYAIGGVSVGEGHELLCKVTEHTAPLLPEDRPRYLMGVGLPEDLLAAIGYGIDLFDCVIPTRYARSATVFTARGTHPPDQPPLPPRRLPHRHLLRLPGLRRRLHAAPTCTTSSPPTRSSPRSSPRSTTCTSTSAWCGGAREAILAERFADFRREFLASYAS